LQRAEVVKKQAMIGGVVPSSIHNKLNGGKNMGLDESDKADGEKRKNFLAGQTKSGWFR
jgi:hypothetical protein